MLAGRADLGIATLGGSAELPSGLLSGLIAEEAYALVHPAGHPDPKALPLLDWDENCGSSTRSWWAAQDWIPRATVKAEDDGMVLTMVGRGLGMAILPELSLREAAWVRRDRGPGAREAHEAGGIRHHPGISVHARCHGSDQGNPLVSG